MGDIIEFPERPDVLAQRRMWPQGSAAVVSMAEFTVAKAQQEPTRTNKELADQHGRAVEALGATAFWRRMADNLSMTKGFC